MLYMFKYMLKSQFIFETVMSTKPTRTDANEYEK